MTNAPYPTWIQGALLILASIVVWSHLADYRRAVSPVQGSTPIELVYKVVAPENFQNDFPSGIENYLKSAFAHVYPMAYRWLNISPETMVPAVMLFEILLIAVTLFLLVRVCGAAPAMGVALFVALIYISSNIQFMDIGKVGHYIHGKVNNVADMLRLLALAAFLTRRILLAGILLGLCFAVNPIYACLTAVLMGAACLVQPPPGSWRRIGGGVALFVLIGALWFAWLYPSESITLGGIPSSVWFEISRLCSGHWFPMDLGVLTFRHHLHFLPLLSFMVLMFHFMAKRDDLTTRRLFMGFAAMLPLMIVGVLAARLEIHQGLVKAQIFRADQIFLTAGLIYVVAGLLNEISVQTPVRAGLAAAALFSPFFIKPGFPLIYSLALVGPGMLTLPWRDKTHAQRFVALFLTAIVGLMIYYGVAGYLQVKNAACYLGSLPVNLIGLTVFLGCLVLRNFDLKLPQTLIKAALVVLCIGSAVWWVRGFAPTPTEIARNQDYEKVQRWAAQHTPVTTLFMVDPTIYFGWRDFSRRSSFGNLREWLYGWTNTNDAVAYRDGFRRFNEFGLDYRDYLNREPASIRGFFALRKAVRKRYNEVDRHFLTRLAETYGIDYFVFAKAYLKQPVALPAAFENDHFIVLHNDVLSPIPDKPTNNSGSRNRHPAGLG